MINNFNQTVQNQDNYIDYCTFAGTIVKVKLKDETPPAVEVPENLAMIIKAAKNKAGNEFYSLKATTKLFAQINKFFKDNYGIDNVLYNYQYKKSKQVDANGYYTLPDGTRVKESACSKTGDRTVYIQSEKFKRSSQK